jgi:tRNA modification GTPase
MARSYLDIKSPIVALATQPGRAALSVIRCSGDGSIERLKQCFSKPEALARAPGYTMVHGAIVDPDSHKIIDDCIAAVFRAPKSFTGEDSVELYCHGSMAVATKILEILESLGFAPALPGEFTFRAFINGKTDLVQAEAVNELSGAICESAREDAVARLSGTLSDELGKIRSELLDVAAEIEARLDYPDDEGPDVEPIAHDFSRIMSNLEASLVRLSQSYIGGKLRQEGALVVLAGRPNAGKSSLFNLIVREERAIVSPEPGTTRDWLESWVEMQGFAIRLVDTAGLRTTEGDIEAEGVRRSLNLVESADAILYMVDGRRGLIDDDAACIDRYPHAIKLWNKIDAADCQPVPPGWTGISAKNVESLAGIETSILSRVRSISSDSLHNTLKEKEIRIASSRQKILIDRSIESIRNANAHILEGQSLDIIALDLREAMGYMGEITGDIVADEVFDRIFGKFCLGK